MTPTGVRWDRVLTWTAVTFTVSALLGFAPKMLGIPFKPPVSTVVAVLFMWVPGAVSIVLARRWYGTVAAPLGLRLKPSWWIAGAFAFPIVGSFLSLGLTYYMPGVAWFNDGSGFLARIKDTVTPEQLEEARKSFAEVSVAQALLMIAVGGVFAGATVNALAALGEELGWRGFLYRELRPLGFWPSTLLTGVIWGFWHAPLVLQGHNYPDAPVAGVFYMVLFCVAIAPMHAWAREKLDSVVAAAFTHGALNATAGAVIFFVAADAPSLWVGFPGVPGFITGAILSIVVAVLRWRAPVVLVTASSVETPVEQAGS